MASKPSASKKTKAPVPSGKKAPTKPAGAKPEARKPAPKPVEKPAAKAPAKPAPAKPEVKKPDPKKPETKKPEPKSVAKSESSKAGAKFAPASPSKTAAPAKGSPATKPKDAKSTAAPVKPGAKVDPKAAAPAKGGKPDPKAAKGGKDLGPPKPAQRYNVMSSDAMAAGRAAAAKLAALAGLQPVQSTANGDRSHKPIERLTKSPFSKKELVEFREILVSKRAQILGDVNSLESEALTGGAGGSLSHLPQHMADQGTDTFDQSLALDLVASQRTLLKEINDAITRIDGGTYGICEELGKAISVERLRHTPWARFCIEAARQHERTAWFR